MPGILWNDAFSVGSQPLDDQHKKWFDLYNEVRLCAKQDDPPMNPRRVVESIKTMMDYSAEHFQAEEAYMKTIGFPGLDDHAAVHSEFKQTVNRFYREFVDGSQVSCEQLLDFVKDWLLMHVAGEDRAYATFSKGV